MRSDILESITEDLLSIPPLTLKIVTAHYAITVTTLTKYKTPRLTLFIKTKLPYS